MTKIYRFFILTISLCSVALFAQATAPAKGGAPVAPASTTAAPASGGTAVAANTSAPANNGDSSQRKPFDKLSTYFPITNFDYRMEVSNVSFARKHAYDGKGEILDVIIQMSGKDFNENDYQVYVLALTEIESQNKDERKLVSYPAWRPVDHSKNNKVVIFSKLSPEMIPVKDVFNDVYGAESYEKILKEAIIRQRSASRNTLPLATDLEGYADFLTKNPGKNLEPNLEAYVMYLSKNPSKALNFKMYGEISPTRETVLGGNFSPMSEDEKKRDVNMSNEKHTYTLFYNKYKTTIYTHHYVQYRPDFVFFNKVAILIFDPKRDSEQKEGDFGKLVYRSIFDVGHIKHQN